MSMQLSLFDDIEVEEPEKVLADEVNEYKNKYPNVLSRKVLSDFNADPQLAMCDFPQIYRKILSVLPQEKVDFSMLDIKSAVSCEFICAAICHKINWDFLRESVLMKTLSDPAWITPARLKIISAIEIGDMLAEYDKKDRIRAGERAALLRNLGQLAVEHNCDFIDLISSKDKLLKEYSEITGILKSCSVFSFDPIEKKLQFLIQKLANYKQFESLGDYSCPTIDYHLIRLFLRRGLIIPITESAKNYIMELTSGRRENTIAALRFLCSTIVETISTQTSLNINIVNQIEWWIERSICLSDSPDCYLEKEDSDWIKKEFGKCPFDEDCIVINSCNKDLILNEPLYTGTSY